MGRSAGGTSSFVTGEQSTASSPASRPRAFAEAVKDISPPAEQNGELTFRQPSFQHRQRASALPMRASASAAAICTAPGGIVQPFPQRRFGRRGFLAKHRATLRGPPAHARSDHRRAPRSVSAGWPGRGRRPALASRTRALRKRAGRARGVVAFQRGAFGQETVVVDLYRVSFQRRAHPLQRRACADRRRGSLRCRGRWPCRKAPPPVSRPRTARWPP